MLSWVKALLNFTGLPIPSLQAVKVGALVVWSVLLLSTGWKLTSWYYEARTVKAWKALADTRLKAIEKRDVMISERDKWLTKSRRQTALRRREYETAKKQDTYASDWADNPVSGPAIDRLRRAASD